MNDNDLYVLATEAEKLAQDINTKLDNPDYVFDDSAKAIMVQLHDVAQRCRAANLRSAARRLEQLAREVREHS